MAPKLRARGKAGLRLAGTPDPLVASCETRSAARGAVAAADEPGVLLLRECGYAQPVAAGAIRSPANFESRSPLTAAPRPPLRGMEGAGVGRDRVGQRPPRY
jgi:hypothetical protein